MIFSHITSNENEMDKIESELDENEIDLVNDAGNELVQLNENGDAAAQSMFNM